MKHMLQGAGRTLLSQGPNGVTWGHFGSAGPPFCRFIRPSCASKTGPGPARARGPSEGTWLKTEKSKSNKFGHRRFLRIRILEHWVFGCLPSGMSRKPSKGHGRSFPREGVTRMARGGVPHLDRIKTGKGGSYPWVATG